MATRGEINQLIERIDQLETLLKDFINATDHKHYWDVTGSHDTQDMARKCGLCGKCQKYVYPMRPYEHRWEDYYEGSY